MHRERDLTRRPNALHRSTFARASLARSASRPGVIPREIALGARALARCSERRWGRTGYRPGGARDCARLRLCGPKSNDGPRDHEWSGDRPQPRIALSRGRRTATAPSIGPLRPAGRCRLRFASRGLTPELPMAKVRKC
jgi:hypothetical protein